MIRTVARSVNLAPAQCEHLELVVKARTGEHRSRIDATTIHLMRPGKQPITKHNSTFRDITLARICNCLQIRNTRERESSNSTARRHPDSPAHRLPSSTVTPEGRWRFSQKPKRLSDSTSDRAQ